MNVAKLQGMKGSADLIKINQGIDINKNLLDPLNMYVENFLDHKEKMKHIKWFCLSIRQKPHVIHTSAK